jgi:hypothetical protein
MRDKLSGYVNGEIHYTPIMNILMNNRSKDWYAELGKYIVEIMDISKIPELAFLSDGVKQDRIKTRIKNWLDSDRNYSSVSIFFLTSALNEQSLKKMFGEPIFHSEFGEGFTGEYDEELDEYEEPDVSESYASYFVNISGTEFHIGYDHRGTSIEIGLSKDFNYNSAVSDSEIEKCFVDIKNLIDLYKSRIVL